MANWKRLRIRYAKYVLVNFRPEPHVYEAGHINNYNYSWEELQRWLLVMRGSSRAIDRLRLKCLHNHLHGMTTDFKTKSMLAKYRARARERWNDKDKARYAAQRRAAAQRERSQIDDYLAEQDAPVLSAHEQAKVERKWAYTARALHTLQELYASPTPQPPTARVSTHGAYQQQVWQGNLTELRRISVAMQQADLGKMKAEWALWNPIAATAQTEAQSAHATPVTLTNDQQCVLDWLHRKVVSFDRKSGKRQPMALITGPPGAGKSFAVKVFKKEQEAANRSVPATAYTGIATILANGIDTVCGLVGMGWGDSNVALPPLGAVALELFREKVGLSTILALVIDEVSTVPGRLIEALSQRFQQATGDASRPFGGIPVIFVGDFNQLPPVGNITVIRALLQSEKRKADRANQERQLERNKRLHRE